MGLFLFRFDFRVFRVGLFFIKKGVRTLLMNLVGVFIGGGMSVAARFNAEGTWVQRV